MKDSLDYFLKVKTADIYLYAPFFEAFEGMLSLRTPNPTKEEFSTMHFLVSADFKDEFEALIKRLGLDFIFNN
ncbi:MAG: hypothetical protein HQ564_07210 [Candidatus Saganbacteria bacterium]|nr:hypothetical protein [Candidatus Saganbacteria bacterium]